MCIVVPFARWNFNYFYSLKTIKIPTSKTNVMHFVAFPFAVVIMVDGALEPTSFSGIGW